MDSSWFIIIIQSQHYYYSKFKGQSLKFKGKYDFNWTFSAEKKTFKNVSATVIDSLSPINLNEEYTNQIDFDFLWRKYNEIKQELMF